MDSNADGDSGDEEGSGSDLGVGICPWGVKRNALVGRPKIISLGAEICILHCCQFVCHDFMYSITLRALHLLH